MKLIRHGWQDVRIIGRLKRGDEIVQPFIPLLSKMSDMFIYMSTYCGEANATVTLDIVDYEMKKICSASVSSASIPDNSYARFRTNLQSLQTGRVYYIRLTSDGNEYNSPTCRGGLDIDRDADARMHMKMNGERTTCFLNFITAYDIPENFTYPSDLDSDPLVVAYGQHMKKPVSVLVTAYDNPAYLAECLDSICRQTYFQNYDEYEILLGVDGNLETCRYAMSIASRYKNLSIYMMPENKGTYVTTNTLISLSRYGNIVRFDSDDIMCPDMLDNLSFNMYVYDYVRLGCCLFTGRPGDGDGKIRIPDGVIYVRKQILDEVGGYMPWRCTADSELYWRVKPHYSTYDMRKLMFYRRKHPDSLTMMPETGFKSELRQSYKDKIRKDLPKNQIYVERVINSYVKVQ